MAGVRFSLDTTSVDAGAKRIQQDFTKIGTAAWKAEVKIKGLESQTKKLSTGLGRSEREVKKLKTEIHGLMARTEKLTQANKKLIASQNSAANATEKSRGKLVTFVRTVASTAATLMILDRAIKEVQAAMSVGIEFEQKIAEVRAIARATIQEFGAISAAARKAGRETIWSASESADALRYLARAGFTVTEAISALSDTLAIAQIGELELGRATDIVSDTLRAFNLEVDQLTRVVDVFTGTITRTNTDVEMMSDAMKFAAPIAAQLGYSVEQTAAMIGILSQSGIKAGIAGRGLQMAFIKTAKAAERLGLSIDADLIDVLRELNIQQISANEISEMFGVRALKSVLVLKSNIDQYDKLNKTLHNVNGESKQYVEGLQTVEVAIKQFVSVIKDYLISVFYEYRETLKEAFDNSKKWITDHKDGLIKAAKVTVTFTKAVIQLGIAFLGLKIITKISTALFAIPVAVVPANASLIALGGSAEVAATGFTALGVALKSIWPILVALAAYKVFRVVIDGLEAKEDLERIQSQIDFMAKQDVHVLVTILEKNPRFYDEEIVKIKQFIAEQKKIIEDAKKKTGTDSIFGEAEAAAGMIPGADDIKKATAEIEKLETALNKIALAQDVVNGVFDRGMTDFWVFKKAEAKATNARLVRIKQTEQLVADMSKDGAVARWKIQQIYTEKITKEITTKYPRAQKTTQDAIIKILLQSKMKEYDAEVKAGQDILDLKQKLIEDFGEQYQRIIMGDVAVDRAKYVIQLNQYVAYLKSMKLITEKVAKEIKKVMLGAYDDKNKKPIKDDIVDKLAEAASYYKDLIGFEDTYHDKMLELIEARRKAEIEANEDVTAANAKAIQARNKLAEEAYSTEISHIQSQWDGYSDMFEGLSQLYDEDSSARNRLHDISMAFQIVEQAMLMVTAVKAAVVAVATQGEGDPYTAFARVAAMAGLMATTLASAGISFSGGGSVSGVTSAAYGENTTVLGGDNNEGSTSISKAWELLEDTYDMEYRELSGIYDEMKSLNQNITGLVSSVLRTGGIGDMGIATGSFVGQVEGMFDDFMGAWWHEGLSALDFLGIGDWLNNAIGGLLGGIFGGGGYTNVTAGGISFEAGVLDALAKGGSIGARQYADVHTHEEGGWFHSDSDSYTTTYADLDPQVALLLDKVFQGISLTLINLTTALGTDMQATLDYVFEAGKLDLQEMDADEINTALTEYFSNIGDIAVEALFGDLVSIYQQVGEGLMETAIRLVIDKAIIIASLDKIGQSFTGTIPEIIAFSEAIIAMSGDLETFRENVETYYDKFFTDLEKQLDLQEQLMGVFTDIGMTLPSTRDGFRSLIEGLDLTTESGQEALVALLAAAAAADEYYSFIEDITEAIDDLLSDQSGLSKELANVNSLFDDWIASLEELGTAEKDVADAEKKRSEVIKKLMAEWYDENIGSILNPLSGLAEEMANINSLFDEWIDTLDALSDVVDAEKDRLEAIKKVMADWYSENLSELINPMNELDSMLADINLKFETWILALGELGDAEDDIIKAEQDRAKVIARVIEEYYEALMEPFESLRTRILSGTDSSASEYRALFDSLMSQYDALDTSSATYYEDSLDLLTRMTDAAESIKEIQEAELSILESQIESIDAMILRLAGGDLAPVQSEDWFTGRYADLLSGATTQEGLDELLNFIPDYIGFMNAYGADMAALNATIIADLMEIKDDLVDRQTELLEEIADNTASTSNRLIEVLNRLDAQLAAMADQMEESQLIQMGAVTASDIAELGGTELFTRASEQGFDVQGMLSNLNTLKEDEGYGLTQSSFGEGTMWAALGPDGTVKAQYTTGDENPFVTWLSEQLKNNMNWSEAQAGFLAAFDAPVGLLAKDWYGNAGHDFSLEAGPFPGSEYDRRMKYNSPEGSSYFYPDTDIQWMYDNFPIIRKVWQDLYLNSGTPETPAGYAVGGYTGNAGGIVHPQEWVVPTLQPENTNFLRSIGVDPEVIGAVIADRISDRDIHVHVEIDGGEIGHVVVNQMRTNPEVIEQTRRVVA